MLLENTLLKELPSVNHVLLVSTVLQVPHSALYVVKAHIWAALVLQFANFAQQEKWQRMLVQMSALTAKQELIRITKAKPHVRHVVLGSTPTRAQVRVHHVDKDHTALQVLPLVTRVKQANSAMWLSQARVRIVLQASFQN